MITWSGFVRFWSASAGRLPRRVREEIRREAVDRYLERVKSGRADSVLDFRDLIDRAERSLV